MTDEETRLVNRAVCTVEDQNLRESARHALHVLFRRQVRSDRVIENLLAALETLRDLDASNFRGRGELKSMVEHITSRAITRAKEKI